MAAGQTTRDRRDRYRILFREKRRENETESRRGESARRKEKTVRHDALRNVSQPRLSHRGQCREPGTRRYCCFQRSWETLGIITHSLAEGKQGEGRGGRNATGAWKRRRYSRYSRRCETLAVALVRSLVPCASRGVSQNINLRLQIISCIYMYMYRVHTYIYTYRDATIFRWSFLSPLASSDRVRAVFSERILLSFASFFTRGDDDRSMDRTLKSMVLLEQDIFLSRTRLRNVPSTARDLVVVVAGSSPLILVDPIFHRVLYF